MTESEPDRIEKRNNMLENMLVLLNSAAALGIGPSPGDLARDRVAAAAYSDEPRSISSPFPGSGKGIRRGWVFNETFMFVSPDNALTIY